MDNILEINNLNVEYFSQKNIFTALKNIDFNLKRGECTGIVGESGCGKSTFAGAVLDIIDKTEGRINCSRMKMFTSEGEKGIDIIGLKEEEKRSIRGKNISLILQDPYNSLNPVIKIGKQMKEAYLEHNPGGKEEVLGLMNRRLEDVQLPGDGSILDMYPHQLSGGMMQRVSIAISLLNSPEILLADEPTSNLDVTIQKKIIGNLKDLKKKMGLSLIFITHNLNLVSEIAEKIYILYCGEFVEYGDSYHVFKNPCHPYTRGLISAMPDISKMDKKIIPIPGSVPLYSEGIKGCSFASRCALKKEYCIKGNIDMIEVEPGHFVRCLCL